MFIWESSKTANGSLCMTYQTVSFGNCHSRWQLFLTWLLPSTAASTASMLMANRDCYHLLLVLAASFSWIYAYQIVCSCQCWRQFLIWLFSKTAVVIANGWNLDCLYMSLTAVAYMISWPAYLIAWGCHNWWHHFLTWLFLGTAVAVINCDLITSLFISVISTVFA